MQWTPDQVHSRATQLLEVLNTAVVLLDEQLTVKYLNPAAENLFEVSRRQFKHQSWPDVVHATELKDRLREALRTQAPFTERELELHTGPGLRITVAFTVTPLDGRSLLLEIIQVDRQLRIAQEEHLLAQQRSARELLRGLAHEIKNPLGGLRGAAQLLDREYAEAGVQEYTQVIIREADRLRNLVDRLLGPNNVPKRELANIHQILEHVRGLVDAERYEGLRIDREYDPSIPELSADAELLIQALINIVRNAAQAGARHIVLRTRTERQFTIGQHRHKLVLRLDIADDGPGIPKVLQENIFYPMVTGRADGTGLGLSIAQSLINKHQGVIEFTSEPGSTVFTIYLPLETNNG